MKCFNLVMSNNMAHLSTDADFPARLLQFIFIF
jgi:hypothetical protein